VTGPADQVPAAAVIATAAVCTWLGAPLVRSRHTRAVRHAIDMTASIAGNRPPSRTVRGLA
jgi:dihydropteroate synthase